MSSSFGESKSEGSENKLLWEEEKERVTNELYENAMYSSDKEVVVFTKDKPDDKYTITVVEKTNDKGDIVNSYEVIKNIGTKDKDEIAYFMKDKEVVVFTKDKPDDKYTITVVEKTNDKGDKGYSYEVIKNIGTKDEDDITWFMRGKEIEPILGGGAKKTKRRRYRRRAKPSRKNRRY